MPKKSLSIQPKGAPALSGVGGNLPPANAPALRPRRFCTPPTPAMLRSLPVVPAMRLRRVHLPARQRRRLKHALEPERRLLIGFSAARWFGFRTRNCFPLGWLATLPTVPLLHSHAPPPLPGFMLDGSLPRSSASRVESAPGPAVFWRLLGEGTSAQQNGAVACLPLCTRQGGHRLVSRRRGSATWSGRSLKTVGPLVLFILRTRHTVVKRRTGQAAVSEVCR
jgi:hypothetical protein